MNETCMKAEDAYRKTEEVCKKKALAVEAACSKSIREVEEARKGVEEGWYACSRVTLLVATCLQSSTDGAREIAAGSRCPTPRCSSSARLTSTLR